MNPEKYTTVPDMILPPNKRLIGIYCDQEKRGYLSKYVQDVEPKDMFNAVIKNSGLPLNFVKK